jgi:hypothetical protein
MTIFPNPMGPTSAFRERLIEFFNMRGKMRYKYQALAHLLANNVVEDDGAVRGGGEGALSKSLAHRRLSPAADDLFAGAPACQGRAVHPLC